MINPRIYIRADGNQNIGYGHAFRMMALVELLKAEQYVIVWVSEESSDDIIHRIKNLEVSIISKHNFEESLDKEDIVVLDGYDFILEVQNLVKSKSAKLVIFSDYIASFKLKADYVINVAGGVKPYDYKVDFYTQVLIGPEYALVKECFLDRKKNAKPASVFICLGGSDANNYTQKILESLLHIRKDINHVDVVVGGSYQYFENLMSFSKSHEKVHVHCDLSSEEVAEMMSRSFYAITSASTIAYEYGFISGNLYLVQTAANQEYLLAYMLNKELALSLNDFFDSTIQERVSQNQQRHFNQKFKKNYSNVFSLLSKEINLNVRKAELTDVLTFFKWVNDPEVRSQSFNTDSIELIDHQKWFYAKLESSSSVIYIGEIDNTPLGQVRFEYKDKCWVIDYSIDKKFRGQGYGYILLKKCILNLIGGCGSEFALKAEVKKQNRSSVRVFEKLKFRKIKETEEVVEFWSEPE